MTADHTADACPYSWCTAHAPACTCPYADIHPHRAAGCRHAPEPDGDLRNRRLPKARTEGQEGAR